MKAWAPSEEEFAAWRDEPVTRWVMEGLRRASRENQRKWTASSWTSGKADQDMLTSCRTLAAAYQDVVEMDHEGWVLTHAYEGSEA